MSGPGIPGDALVKSRFAAGRGAAQSSDVTNFFNQLAEGGGGAQTVASTTPSAGASPPSAGLARPGAVPSQPDLPIGQRIQQAFSSTAAGVKADLVAPAAASWDQLKKDFVTSTGLSPEAQQAFHSGSFWDQMKSQWHAQMAQGAVPFDAFKTAISPLTGGVNAATGLVAKAAFKLLPEVPGYGEKDFHAALNTAASLVGPEAGEGGLAAKAGEADAAAAPKAAPAATEKSVSATPNAADKFKWDGLPPDGRDNTIDPTTGKKWDPNMPFAARSARVLKAFPGLQQVPWEPDEALAGEGLTPPPTAEAPRPFDLAGEQPGKTLKITPEVRAQAVDFLSGKKADNPIQVSLEGLSKDLDLNGTVADLAKMIPKGAVKPDDIRDMNAYSLNLAPDEVLSRLTPQIPTDELQAAAGMLVNSAGSEFQKFAKTAMEDPTPANQELAVRAYAQANQVIGKFRDAGTDLGRGLRARQATVEGRDDFTAAIHQVIADVGPENVDEAIRKAAALPDPKTVAPFVSSMRWMPGRDGLLYGWYNWLLSNPATIVKKLVSDASVAGWNVAVRYAAEKFGGGDVRPGEAAALWQGYTGSMRDGLSAAAKALKEGHSQFYGDYQTMDGRVIESTANHEGAPGVPEEPTASAIQYIRSALPTSWIGAADDFAKVVNYRAEARALLYRDGMIKGLDNDALAAHVTDTMNNMPEHIHVMARNAALKNTFQEPLSGIAEKLQDIVDKINIPVPKTGIDLPLGRVIMPFVKVPANIAKFAYRNGPLAAMIPSQALKAELAAGGATRDMAIARMGLGTAVSSIALPFMLAGKITGRGPADPQINRAWQSAGNKPYSVQVGGNWYGYNRVEPIGMHMAALADTVETLKFARDEDAEQLAWSGAFGIGDAMLSKTYMQGMSDFLNALHDPQGEGKYYGDKVVASMALPQGAAALAQATDPWLRQHYGLMDAIQARTPGLASGLPPVRDLWGQPVAHDQGFLPGDSGHSMANLLSPIGMAPAGNAQPIDKWIWDNRASFPDADNGKLGLTRPGQVQTYDAGHASAQIKLSDQQLDRMRALTGNELKDPRTNLGARDALNALVQGNYPQAGMQAQWDKASPAARALMVLKVWNSFRDGAKKQLLSENPDMQATLAEKLNTRVDALKAPSIGEGP